MEESPPKTSEQFEMVVDLLKHEDNLINLRTNWALALQALLFTAFAATLGLFEKFVFSNPRQTPVHVGLFILCGLGVLSCIAAQIGVKAAESQQLRLREWWQSKLDGGVADAYPPLYPIADLKSKRRASQYFIVIAAVWIGILLTVFFSQELVIRAVAK